MLGKVSFMSRLTVNIPDLKHEVVVRHLNWCKVNVYAFSKGRNRTYPSCDGHDCETDQGRQDHQARQLPADADSYVCHCPGRQEVPKPKGGEG